MPVSSRASMTVLYVVRIIAPALGLPERSCTAVLW